MVVLEILLAALAIFIGLVVLRFLLQFYASIFSFYENTVETIEELADSFGDFKEHITSKIKAPRKSVRIAVLCGTLLIACAILALAYSHHGDYDVFLEVIMNNTAIVAFINMLISGFSPTDNITVGSMVSIGLASCLTSLYMLLVMQNLEQLSLPRWLTCALNLLFQIVLFCLAALLAGVTANWCDTAASFLVDYFATHLPACITAENFLLKVIQFIYNTIITVVLLCAALVAFVLVFKEYLEVLIFGFFSLIFSLLVVIVLQNLLHCPTYITEPLLLLTLISGEFIRNNQTLKEWYSDLLHTIEDS